MNNKYGDFFAEIIAGEPSILLPKIYNKLSYHTTATLGSRSTASRFNSSDVCK
jgi:hypothetical protein